MPNDYERQVAATLKTGTLFLHDILRHEVDGDKELTDGAAAYAERASSIYEGLIMPRILQVPGYSWENALNDAEDAKLNVEFASALLSEAEVKASVVKTMTDALSPLSYYFRNCIRIGYQNRIESYLRRPSYLVVRAR